MNAPMLSPPVVPMLSGLFVAACELDVTVFKPGNVSVDSPGHGMTASDFLTSATASAPHVANPELGVGERIYRAVEATRRAVNCNTNLGILLLAAPLLHAAQNQRPGEALARRLHHTLNELGRADAEWAYRAIRFAAPGGLGGSRHHDVNNEPEVTLLKAMQEASSWDRIAYQYASCYADILGAGLASLRQGRERWGNETAAFTTVYLCFLASFPDTHVRRKHGDNTARQVQRLALNCIASLKHCTDWPRVQNHLEGLDRVLKSAGINPGTTADLTVATWLAAHLSNEQEACISYNPPERDSVCLTF